MHVNVTYMLYFYFNSHPTEWKPLINAPAIWKYIFNTLYWKDSSHGWVIKGQLEAIKMKRQPIKQQGNSSAISTNDWQPKSKRDAFASLNHCEKTLNIVSRINYHFFTEKGVFGDNFGQNWAFY